MDSWRNHGESSFWKYLFSWSDQLDQKRVLKLTKNLDWNLSKQICQNKYFLSIFCRENSDLTATAWHEFTTRVFRRPLLLPTLRVIEYSDDVKFLFHPSHLLYHLPAPLPDNSIMIVIVVSVWTVLLMMW